jgi:hypothetical protein
MVNWLSIGFAGHHYVSHHAEMWWNRESFSHTFQFSTLYISIRNMSSRRLLVLFASWLISLSSTDRRLGLHLCLRLRGVLTIGSMFGTGSRKEPTFNFYSWPDHQSWWQLRDFVFLRDISGENRVYDGYVEVAVRLLALVQLFFVLKDLVTVGSIWSQGRPLSAQFNEPSDHASVLDSCLKCGLAFLNTRTWFSAGFCLQAGFRDFQCEYKNVLAPCFRFGHLICVVWLLLCSENGE